MVSPWLKRMYGIMGHVRGSPTYHREVKHSFRNTRKTQVFLEVVSLKGVNKVKCNQNKKILLCLAAAITCSTDYYSIKGNILGTICYFPEVHRSNWRIISKSGMSDHISVAHYAAEKMDAFSRDILNHIHQRKITKEKIARMYKQNMHTHIHKFNCMHTYQTLKI